MSSPEIIEYAANSFVRRYYHGLQTDPHTLAPFYNDNSQLTFNGGTFQGAAAIVGKLQSIPVGIYGIGNLYAQPSMNGGIYMLVQGSMQLNPELLSFYECFQIMPTTEDYWILNQIFKLDLPG